MKPIFVFCEGSHDIGFASRVFKANGASPYKKKLAEYEPKLLSQVLIKHLENRDIESGRFRPKGSNQGAFVAEVPPILTSVWRLPDPDRLILFFRCHGDGYEKSVSKFLDGIVPLSLEANPDLTIGPIGLAFTLDADQDGVDARVKQIADNFAGTLSPIFENLEGLQANKADGTVRNGSNSIGCFVFHENGKSTGTLEDTLWPFMSSKFEDRSNDALGFVNKYAYGGCKVLKGENPEANKRKAAMTIMGQIESPGYSLPVIIRDTPAITNETILADPCSIMFWEVMCSI